MKLVKRKIAQQGMQPVGYDLQPGQAESTKRFNRKLRYCQGFRVTIAATSTTPVSISLNSPGKQLLGISMVPASGNNADIADCQLELVVNNNNILLDVSAQNANPNFVGSMIFFPTPQPLAGKDNILLKIIKNNANAVVAYVNVFYVPQ